MTTEPETPRRPVVPERVRTWLYGIVTAALPVLAYFGLLEDEAVPLFLGLAGALLATGTALAYRPTRTNSAPHGTADQ